MKKFFSFILKAKWSFAAAVLLGILLVSSCKKDDPDPPSTNPIASFQFEVDTDNFLMVAFTNFSQNAVSYAWDFGDGNTSTEESPTYTYAAAGTYTVTLTATGDSGTTPSAKSETVTLSDPNEQLTLLAGANGKKWYLDREGIALGIGPALNDNQWWGFGTVTPHGERPCIVDDYYVFNRDGSWELFTNGTVFCDSYGNGGWLDTEQCVSADEPDKLVGENGEDLSIYTTNGTYSYTYDPTINSLTISGEGAYIGLPNKTNNGDNYLPVASREFTIFNFVDGDGVDSLHMGMINPANGDTWNFYLVHYENEADLPDIPSSVPSAAFAYTKEGNVVTFTNQSKNSTSYSWDFGDGGSSAEENPVYTYGSDGTYTVTLTAMDDNGNSATASQDVTISSDVFTPAVLSSADGKVWKLAGVASFYVGGSEGSGEWWGGITEDDLEARACMLDDEFIFFDNGDYIIDTKGAIFGEPYMGVEYTCANDADLVAPYDGLASGNHTFEANDATVRVVGNGAFIGFSKAFNGGEYTGAEAELAQEITYNVFDYATSDEKEIIKFTVDISADQDGTAWWTVVMESLK